MRSDGTLTAANLIDAIITHQISRTADPANIARGQQQHVSVFDRRLETVNKQFV